MKYCNIFIVLYNKRIGGKCRTYAASERYRMKKRTHYILFGSLLLLVIFLRVFHIATTPLGMHIDEAGMGLNAWSIANFGTDRHGNPMPVCSLNFYSEQSAFYTYFCALLVKIFGLNIYTLRMPAAVMGVLAVLFVSLLIREKWGTKGFFTGMALSGIFPYFIMNSRFAFDCNAMLGSLAIALYCLVRLIKKAEKEPDRKLYGLFTLTGILFGITLYTYIVAAIVVAVFCVLFGLYYLLYKKCGRFLRLKQLLFLAVPLGIMAVPLIMFVCVNYFDLDPIVTPIFSIPKMITNRTKEVAFSLSVLPRKLRSLLHLLTSDGIYGSSDKYLTMYPLSIPFILAGGIHSICETVKGFRQRTAVPDFFMLLLAFAEIFMFLLCGQYNYHINGIFTALVYFCVSGIFCVMQFIKKETLRIGLAVTLIFLYGISFIGFAAEYFGADNAVAYQVFGGADGALALLSDEQKGGEIYIMDEVGEFYFLSNPIPPSEFSAACDELGYITDYGNLHFRQPDSYSGNDVYVCNKASGNYYRLSDTSVTGCTYAVLETAHYYVFYCE